SSLPFFFFIPFVISSNVPLFVSIDPIGSSASASSSSLAGLGSQSGSKKIKACVKSIYLCGSSYKKTKLPGVSGGIMDSLDGLILVGMLHGDGVELQRSWGSEVDSEEVGVSEVSDAENLESAVVKETNYMDPNTFETNEIEDDITPRKTQTRTLILEQPPKAISFAGMNNDDIELVLSEAKFAGCNQLPSVISRVLECRAFEPVKSFALDVELSNVSGKTNRASTPSKFPGIIQSTFTSGSSLNKAREMVINEKIIVNDDLKKINNHSDWKIIIKEIPIDLPKSAIEAVFSKFGKIISIKMQLIGLWQKALVEFESTETACLVMSKWSVLVGKDFVHVALAISDKELWILRDHYHALLYTLPVGTTAHDLSELIEAYDEKTCFIGRNSSSYVHNRCAVICFENKAFKLAAIGSVPVFKGVSLQWTGFFLVSCTQCKQFGYITINCSLGGNSGDWVCLTGIYKKKLASIFCPMSFTGKTWAQVTRDLNSCMASLSPDSSLLLAVVPLPQFFLDVNNRFATLEHSLASFAEQVNKLAKRLDALRPTVSQHGLGCQPLMTPLSQNQGADTVMSESSGAVTSGRTVAEIVVYDLLAVSKLEDTLDILSKTVMGLLAKLENAGLATCNVRDMNNFAKQEDIVHWHKDSCNLVYILIETKLKDKAYLWLASKFNSVHVFSSGLASGYTKAGVVMILNNSLAKHVSKISEIPGHLLCIKLLFKNKLLVSILGLYAGVFLTARFSQAAKINSLIARAVNESFFVILGGDFNEDGSWKYASLKKCFDLNLVNSLEGSSFVKLPTWCNSHGVTKTIDYMFILSNLIGAVVNRSMAAVNDYFDTNHKAVSVSMGFGDLLDVQLNSLHKQTNRDHWKYNFMSADSAKWIKFKKDMAANAAMFCDEFGAAGRSSDLDLIWNALHQVVCLSAESSYDSVFNRASSRFHKLELLVLRIVKTSRLAFYDEFVSLLGLWSGLDSINASVVKSLFFSDSHFDAIWLVLAKIRKSYHLSKLSELDCARESQIRLAIDRRMESFELNKGHTIRSVLECPFCKVVLDHLVMGDELILKPNFVKSKMDVIIEVFSGVMSLISFDKLFGVVFGLSDGKAAGLSGISNKLWKHCDRFVLDMLLVLLNSCLSCESWEGVLTNTYPIALIETAYKIFSDRISLACSMFNVLCGDNFSVLKGTSTQSPIFAVGSIIEDALEKDCKLWLVLQDMKKAYDSVGWEHLSKCLVRIKMCNKFIWFFSVITDFGLTSDYHVHNVLDQEEVFSPLFSLRATQHILNVAMVIPINSRVSNPSLFISGSPISIAWKEESHQYLGIFFSTKDLLKPSLIKAHSDIHFFTNLVLRKAITDKQLLYLVLVVLHPIVSYRTQFSFVPIGACNKWDAMIRKTLKLKSGLPLNFPGNMIHHPSFYGLKSFLQVQSEDKVISLISFVNSSGILGHLFSHRSYDLQVLCWHSVHPLSCLVRICVSASNNFLAGLVCILFNCKLFLGGSLANAFHFNGGVLMLALCDHHGSVFSWYAFKWWKRLDPHRPISDWFRLSAAFLDGITSSSALSSVLDDVGLLNIFGFGEFLSVCNCLSCVETGGLSVYTDGSLRNLGMISCKAGAAAFFENVGLGLGIGMSGLMSSTLVELQAIALALECILSSSSVCLFSDSQSALDVCKVELGLLHSDFHIKGHFGVEENKQADLIAGFDSLSSWFLPPCLDEHFLVTDGVVISGLEVKFLTSDLISEIDWSHSSLVWHLDLHMAAGFTSRVSANACTYFIKTLHHRLPVAVCKCLYNRFYPSVLCLYCSEVEVSDHVFSCGVNDSAWRQLLEFHVKS
ncbi:hypothetical protein G9A89_022924, partial [Geosiphon pyriformis]